MRDVWAEFYLMPASFCRLVFFASSALEAAYAYISGLGSLRPLLLTRKPIQGAKALGRWYASLLYPVTDISIHYWAIPTYSLTNCTMGGGLIQVAQIWECTTGSILTSLIDI